MLKKLFHNFLLIIIFLFETKSVFAQDQEGLVQDSFMTIPKEATLNFRNFSVIRCGTSKQATIFSLLEVEALLAISNNISKNKVALVTNWGKYHPAFFSILNMPSNTSDDVKRILLFCLSWDENNLFNATDTIVQSSFEKIKRERPWSFYDRQDAIKIDGFRDEFLKKLITIILKADEMLLVQGNIEENSALRAANFVWLLDE